MNLGGEKIASLSPYKDQLLDKKGQALGYVKGMAEGGTREEEERKRQQLEERSRGEIGREWRMEQAAPGLVADIRGAFTDLENREQGVRQRLEKGSPGVIGNPSGPSIPLDAMGEPWEPAITPVGTLGLAKAQKQSIQLTPGEIEAQRKAPARKEVPLRTEQGRPVKVPDMPDLRTVSTEYAKPGMYRGPRIPAERPVPIAQEQAPAQPVMRREMREGERLVPAGMAQEVTPSAKPASLVPAKRQSLVDFNVPEGQVKYLGGDALRPFQVSTEGGVQVLRGPAISRKGPDLNAAAMADERMQGMRNQEALALAAARNRDAVQKQRGITVRDANDNAFVVAVPEQAGSTPRAYPLSDVTQGDDVESLRRSVTRLRALMGTPEYEVKKKQIESLAATKGLDGLFYQMMGAGQ
jgi:hypothetical protein